LFYNVYGPTESTVNTSLQKITEDHSIPVIGQPIANIEIYILDSFLNPVPAGVPGELCIAGHGLARGYLHKPELTDERFINVSFQVGDQQINKRIYRSGDLVRLLSNGCVQFIDRIDSQVKLRGYRIELGEIESVLCQHNGIKEAVVLVREDQPGDQRLVAYTVLTAEKPEQKQLKQHLMEFLPEYMIPGVYIDINEIPLTAHGKIDKKALPVPELEHFDVESSFEAPRNPIEEVLSDIWSEVLGLKEVGISQNFFNLGGHSLLATQVISKIRDHFDVEVALRKLFESPTVARLAMEIEAAMQTQQGDTMPEIVAVSRDQSIPLSFSQERLWFLDQLEPENALYNIPAAVELQGEINLCALEASVNQVIQRHESLRTRFRAINGKPIQIIEQDCQCSIHQISLDDGNDEQAIIAKIRKEIDKPFSLSTDLLIRVSILKIKKDQHILLFLLHHIVSDGWSTDVLIHEITQNYIALLDQTPANYKVLTIQYADFSFWQRNWLQGDVLQKQVDFWVEKLQGAPAILELPTDRPRPVVQTYVGHTSSFDFPNELSQKIKSFSRQHDVTLNMLLLTAYQILLSRYSGQDDICVGTPVANRNHSELEVLIGFFVNTIVMRTKIDSKSGFEDILKQVRQYALEAYAHQDLPFEKVVEVLQPERNMGHTPLFQVMFALQKQHNLEIDLPEISIKPFAGETGISKFDLSLFIEDGEDNFTGRIEYNTDLFNESTIAQLQKHYVKLIEGMLQHPELAIAKIPLLTRDERQVILSDWNNKQVAYNHQTIQQIFEQMVNNHAENTALIFGETHLTYRQLNEKANQLAHLLLAENIRAGQKIAICFDRSIDFIVGIIAILKTGCAYVPLDPNYPEDRLIYMLEDTEAPFIITDSLHAKLLPTESIQMILVDEKQQIISEQSLENPTIESSFDQLVYVIYTSGSTGKPKGVCVSHQGVVRLVLNTDYVDINSHDTFSFASNISFDAATFEIWGALLNGATLVGVTKDTALSPRLYVNLIQQQQISIMFITTALFNQIAREIPDGFNTIKSVLFGGEACDPTSVRRVLSAGGPESLNHVYGPTENTTFSTWYPIKQVHQGDVTIPIGYPIANSTCYVLDPLLEPVPIGVHGELYVGGDGLAQGYLNRPDITSETFIEHDFGQQSINAELSGSSAQTKLMPLRCKLYKTGDRVRFLADSSIEFIGRVDHQVKIRGFRIEIGEIEAVFGQVKGLKEVYVMVREDVPGVKRIVAYVVMESVDIITIADIKAEVKQTLPDYMVPTAIITLNELPLTPNGKVDRKKLPKPEGGQGNEFILPRDKKEENLLLIWSDLLGLDKISVRDNFFELGGHSLLATQVISRVKEAFHIELPVKALFESPTIESLALALNSTQNVEQGLQSPPILPIDKDHIPLLSFSQERLWFLQQYETESHAYHIPVAVRLLGHLDIVALEHSFTEVIHRHKVLRTSFDNLEDLAIQKVNSVPDMTLQVESCPDVKTLHKYIDEESKRLFDIKHDLLIRAKLLQFSVEEHILIVVFHHIVADGWSMGVFVKELGALYEAFSQGLASPLQPLKIQYTDYALWQRQWLKGRVLDQQTNYWKQKLENPTLLELPTDFSRPAQQTFDGCQHLFNIESGLSQALQKIASQHGATPFMAFIAAFKILLFRYSRQQDIFVGTPIAGRHHVEIEDLIGLFINTQVIRSELTPDMSFTQLLHQIRQTSLDAFAHQDLPFEMLIQHLNAERDVSRSPLFQVMFMFQNLPIPDLELHGIKLEMIDIPSQTAKFDLTMTLTETHDGVSGILEYNKNLFREESIQRMAGHYQCLLENIVNEPGMSLSQIPLLNSAELKQLTVDSNQTEMVYPEGCFHHLFERHAEQHPEAIAIEFEQQSISYQQLNQRANQLARHLKSLKVSPDQYVGLYLSRNIELIVSILAIHKAGAAYLPLDPAYPAERLAYMLADSEAPIVLVNHETSGSVPNGSAKIVNIESIDKELNKLSNDNLDIVACSDDLAYIIYTSGSTGKPKGVQIEHRNLLNFLVSMQQQPGMKRQDKLLAVTSLSFDIATLELYLPLITGATVVLASRDETLDAGALIKLIDSKKISMMQATPATWKMMLTMNWSPSHKIKALCGGEAFPVVLSHQMLDVGNIELWNMYGPTETTVWSTVFNVTEKHRVNIPVGKAIGNTQVYIMDESLNIMPIGVPGELLIAGDGLARGYLNRQDLTDENFIEHPDEPFGHLYKTGDLARMMPDGN
ncbi:MAG: amino acid adenylation domain-containing protein, partial [Methylococcales bacterium]|nr:amino acid adenylation domain-containing protein [Methylococcales bacterium]